MRPKNKTAHELLMRVLVTGCDKPAEALEIYYWSKEPGFLEIIRAIAMMPEETRSVIEALDLPLDVARQFRIRDIGAAVPSRADEEHDDEHDSFFMHTLRQHTAFMRPSLGANLASSVLFLTALSPYGCTT